MKFGLLAFVFSSLLAAVAFRAPSHPPPVPDYLREAGVKRLRPVIPNRTLFNAAAASRFSRRRGEPIAMNFFPDAVLMIRWQAVDQSRDRIIWTGTVDGTPYGHAVLVVSGRSLTGNFTRGDGLMYQVRTAENGTVWIRELDQKTFENLDHHR